MSQSPEYIKTSMAAAITLGLERGRFYRNARLTGLNLLLTYDDFCKGRCAYCGLRYQKEGDASDTFIRVEWPTYKHEEILAAFKSHPHIMERVCLSMQTHRRAWDDNLHIINRWANEGQQLISALIAPTVCRGKPLSSIKEAGADMCGVAIDCATPELFDRYRGKGIKGPHRWEHYWNTVGEAVDTFGSGNVGIHLIVGLGESELEAIQVIQKAQDMGASTHLFSFFPEGGTPLQDTKQPPLGQYRRVQLARYIINNGYGRLEDMTFNQFGQLTGFGLNEENLVNNGEAFMTSGCPGKDGKTVACNRPFGNERPSQAIRNFPFPPNEDDICTIKKQLWQGI